MDSIELPIGEMTFEAKVAGPDDGRLVILLHGFPQSSYEWRSQLEALGAAGYRAVAPDQRGYSPGARPEGKQHYAVPHLVADVLAIADELGGHRFDLVGHDWGAAVAWNVADQHPERLRTLTAISVPHPEAFSKAIAAGGDQTARSGYMDFFRTEDGSVEDLMLADDAVFLRSLYQALPEDAQAEYARVHTERATLTAALNWYRGSSKADLFGAVGSIDLPTLFIWGRDDTAVGAEAAEPCGDYVTGPYRFEALDGVGHWVPDEAPERVNELLLEHLAAYG